MPRMQRNNVVLRVKDIDVDRYLTLGYNLTADDGTIIKEALPTDYGTLQTMYLKQQAKINELESVIATLTQENEELKKTRTTKKKSTN